MSRLFASLVFACLVATPGFAADTLTGTWKLVSNNYEVQASGQTGPSMGENPAGYINFTADGRVFVVFSASDRKPAKSDPEKAALLSSLTAYTGLYKVDGDTFTTDVDVAWTPEWVGTKQKRELARIFPPHTLAWTCSCTPASTRRSARSCRKPWRQGCRSSLPTPAGHATW